MSINENETQNQMNGKKWGKKTWIGFVITSEISLIKSSLRIHVLAHFWTYVRISGWRKKDVYVCVLNLVILIEIIESLSIIIVVTIFRLFSVSMFRDKIITTVLNPINWYAVSLLDREHWFGMKRKHQRHSQRTSLKVRDVIS